MLSPGTHPAPNCLTPAVGGLRLALLAVLLLAGSLGCARLSPRPNLDVAGAGPFLNVGVSDQAMLNASAHVGWSVAAPALGYAANGRKGMRQATWAWVAYSVVQEALFHAPDHPDARYGSEVRTDLISRLTVPLAVLLVDKFLLDKEPDADRPMLPPSREADSAFEHRAEARPVPNQALPGGVAAPAEALFFAAPAQAVAPVHAPVQPAPAFAEADTDGPDNAPNDVSVPESGDSFEEDAATLPPPHSPGVR